MVDRMGAGVAGDDGATGAEEIGPPGWVLTGATGGGTTVPEAFPVGAAGDSGGQTVVETA